MRLTIRGFRSVGNRFFRCVYRNQLKRTQAFHLYILVLCQSFFYQRQKFLGKKYRINLTQLAFTGK